MNPKDWLLAIAGFISALLAGIALFFKAKASDKEAELEKRNAASLKKQLNQVVKTTEADRKAEEQGREDVEKKTKANKSGINTFNDW